MPMEPLWDIVLPVMGLMVGTSLGALGMQLTLALTFVEPARVDAGESATQNSFVLVRGKWKEKLEMVGGSVDFSTSNYSWKNIWWEEQEIGVILLKMTGAAVVTAASAILLVGFGTFSRAALGLAPRL